MEFTENKELLARKVQKLTSLSIMLCRLFMNIAIYEKFLHSESDVDDLVVDSDTVLSIIICFDSSYCGCKSYDLYRSYKHALNENLPTWLELSSAEKTMWLFIESEMKRIHELKFTYKPIGSKF